MLLEMTNAFRFTILMLELWYVLLPREKEYKLKRVYFRGSPVMVLECSAVELLSDRYLLSVLLKVTSQQLQVRIAAEEVGIRERSLYDSFSYNGIPSSTLPQIIRLILSKPLSSPDPLAATYRCMCLELHS